MIKKTFFSLFLLIALSLKLLGLDPCDPLAVWLTLDGPPTSSITIHWLNQEQDLPLTLQYREKGESVWHVLSYKSTQLPNNLPYSKHAYALSGLKCDTEYEFKFTKSSSPYFFRTAQSKLERPVSFIAGGDIYHDDKETLEKMHKQIPSLSPDFILLGGDIAYSAPKFSFSQDEFDRWLDFLTLAKQYFRTKEGRLIPVIAAIGNHDVAGRYHQSIENAPFFSLFFMKPQRTTTSHHLLFGNYLSLIILDSGHTQYVGKEQVKWLENALKIQKSIPHKFAAYHVPAWPSVRKTTTKISPAIRAHWVPLFEKYGLNIALEHHDHDYKRTHPIKKGKIDQDGVVYIGDGAWGIKEPRLPKTPEKKWFLAERAALQHFLYITIDKEGRSTKAITSEGKIYDEYTQKVNPLCPL